MSTTTTTTDEPIDTGDRYRWTDDDVDHETVEVLNIWIDEDGVTQVRILEDDERRTITAADIHERVADGRLVLVE